MGKLIAIDKLYMNKIPNSCKECPLTYLDKGDDAYFGAYEKRCVIDDSCVDGMASERAYDCPLVEAIPKDEYKANMVTILKKIQTEIEECIEDTENYSDYNAGLRQGIYAIQQKINKLKGEEDGKIDRH